MIIFKLRWNWKLHHTLYKCVFSTSRGYHEYIRGILWVHLGCSVHRRIIMMHVGGYHEYIGGCSVHWGIPWVHWGIPWVHWGKSWVHRRMFSTSGYIMIHVGEQIGENLSISIESPNVLNIPRCTHDIPRCTHDIPWCTHGILRCTEHPPMYSWYPSHASWYPPMYWTSPNVLMVSLTCIMISPNVLNIPQCTHGIPHMHHDIPQCTEHLPMYSWYPPNVLMVSWLPPMYWTPPRCTHDIPPMYWTPPNVMNIPRCTEHTLYRLQKAELLLFVFLLFCVSCDRWHLVTKNRRDCKCC